MSKIKILPDKLISQIAAGEVVDRPASVVKELVENSLDAGAKSCRIELEQGGMKLISICDDGCGMGEEDAVNSFTRHATSKISSFEDLSNIGSYGFRGEALAAIASISQVVMRTRQSEENSGVEIILSGGKVESKGEIGCPAGTEITIRNLFFNTPARRKFLKREQTECLHAVSAVSHLALVNPAVAFELKHNGKTIIRSSAGTVQSRMADILGINFLSSLLPVEFSTESLKICGFVGEPGMPQNSKRHQYSFINSRSITDPLISKAVTDAYGSRIPPRHYPAFVLMIQINPNEVDVNVHPRKLSVKFLEPSRIYRDILQAVSQALDRREQNILGAQFQRAKFQGAQLQPMQPRGDGTKKQEQLLDYTYEHSRREEGVSHPTLNFKIISQIADSYILVLGEEGIFVVDQHAAHERILYEKLKSKAVEKRKSSQPLLVPVTLECTKEEALFLNRAMEHLENMGFEFDAWSGETFVMRACPSNLRTENLAKIFKNFLEDVMNEKKTAEPLPERLLKMLACKSAVKFGMPMTAAEQEKLLIDLENCQNNSTCPHGRPTRVLLTFDELERRFYRKS